MESRKTYVRVLTWIPAILMASAIFWFSAQPADASTEMSDGVSRLILWLGSRLGLLDGPPEQYFELIERMSYPVRKCAHVTEYVILYLTVLLGFFNEIRTSEKLSENNNQKKSMTWGAMPWMTFLFTFLYACTDEFHQLFVPGRAGMFTDVLIDSSGALVLTILLWRCLKRQAA